MTCKINYKKELYDTLVFNNQNALKRNYLYYLYISKIIKIYINSKKYLNTKLYNLVNKKIFDSPFIIGITGSVSVGKSTISQILKNALQTLFKNFKIDLVTTDNFLYCNEILKYKNLMKKKGFPESYDQESLLNFIYLTKKNASSVIKVPYYSHLKYDILKDREVLIRKPNVLIMEGLTIFPSTSNCNYNKNMNLFLKNYFDFTIYIDANVDDIKSWYIKRFIKFTEIANNNPNSYFYKYSLYSKKFIKKKAKYIWDHINKQNLFKNIAPNKYKANLIIQKDSKHLIKKIFLKKN